MKICVKIRKDISTAEVGHELKLIDSLTANTSDKILSITIVT